VTFYAAAASKAAPATLTAIAGIRPAAGADVQVREIGVFNSTAVASSVGLIRSLTAGTASTSMLGQAQDPQRPASACNFDTAWSGAGTVSTAGYLRKVVLPATIGAGIIWTFGPGELWAKNGATTQLFLWNFSGSTDAALEVYAVWDE
jgi:hypothetical protein